MWLYNDTVLLDYKETGLTNWEAFRLYTVVVVKIV